jgi:hypothetical protein
VAAVAGRRCHKTLLTIRVQRVGGKPFNSPAQMEIHDTLDPSPQHLYAVIFKSRVRCYYWYFKL